MTSSHRSKPPPHDTVEALVGRRLVLTAGGSVVLATVVAACRDDGPRARPIPPPAGEEGTGVEVNVQSIDNTFRPDRIEIAPGTAVVWTNMGRTEHDIIPVEGTAWGIAEHDFPPGASYRHVFSEPGEVAYYCSIHGTTEFGMIGTIVVLDG